MDKLFLVSAIIIAVFFAKIADKYQNKKYIYISILIFSLIAGLRATSVGIDTKAYYYSFNNNFPYTWQFKENGFRVVSNILLNIFGDPVFLMIIYALITNVLIVNRLWDFRKKYNFTFMIFLYGFVFFIETLNIMRQFIAISVIFYATKLLSKKKYVTFSIIVLIMTTIHKTSLLALLILVIYFWKNLSTKNKIMLGIPIFMIATVGVVFVLKYESDHILNYFGEDNRISNLNLTFIYRFVIFVFSYMLYRSKKIIVYGKKIKDKNKDKEENAELINTESELLGLDLIVWVYFIGLCLTSMGMFFFVMARLGYYYLIFELLYWGYMTNKNNKNRKLNMLMISIYAIYVFSLELLKNGSGIFPYMFYL